MKTSTRRRPAWAVSLLALVCVCATAALPGAVAERRPLPRVLAATPAETEARVIVKFKAESTLMRALSANSVSAAPQHAQTLSARLGLSLADGRPIGARAQVVKATGMSSADLAERLAAQSDVEYAVVDERKYALAAPNDPRYATGQTSTPAAGQWYLRPPISATILDATSIVSSINVETAWDVTTGSSGVVVAVLDTGVRFDHGDLAAKLRPGYDFVAGNGGSADIAIANDGDARDPDASDPGDWITPAEDNQVGGQFYHCGNIDRGAYVGASSSWHGTQTAGLIGAATNNGIGMAGAGRDVMLLPVRVLGKCGGYDSDIQAAMLWAAGLTDTPGTTTRNPYPAKIINLSLGSTGACSQAYVDAIKTLNDNRVVVVAAAGNDGLAVGTPANCAGVIAVAGVRHAGTKVGYSDLGPEIAIAAPAGNCVNASGTCLFPLLTTSNSGTTTPVSNANGGAVYTDGGNDASLGTSFSSPLVAGTVGLMMSANANLTPSQLRYAMTSTARAFPQTGAAPVQLVANGPFVPVVACTSPTATAQDSECYCTTATCGAGMLDAGLSVARAAGVAAVISASATSVTAGASIDLNAAGSWPGGGATATLGYQWTITAGSATLSGPTNASTATVVTTGPGTVTANLTVVDSLGRQASSSVALSVATAPVPAGGDSSGGGAMTLVGLLALCIAVAATWAVTPRTASRLR